MPIDGPLRLTVRRLLVPMRASLAAAHGTTAERDVVVVELTDGDMTGWGECAALPGGTYGVEDTAGVFVVLAHRLGPAWLDGADLQSARSPMAAAALEMASLDLELQRRGISLAAHLGSTRREVPAGAVVGRAADITSLAESVSEIAAAGYQRVKVKIEPGWDVEATRAALGAAGPMAVQVDANGSFNANDTDHVAALRTIAELGVTMIEQPVSVNDLDGLRHLSTVLPVPVCIDESAESADGIVAAMTSGAGNVVCLKPGRLGGIDAFCRVAATCAEHGWPAWAGGMVECGIGKAALVALASIEACTMVGDISASDRWFATDLTEPFRLDRGSIAVPVGPGLGVDIDIDAVERFTVSRYDVPHR